MCYEGEKEKLKQQKKKTALPVCGPAGPASRPGRLQSAPARGPVWAGPKAGEWPEPTGTQPG